VEQTGAHANPPTSHIASPITFSKGDVVAVRKPSKVKFATVLADITHKPTDITAIPVLYLEEIQAADCLGVTPMTRTPMTRNVHFFTHVSKKIAHVRISQLVDACRTIRWGDSDIFDHSIDGTFRNVSRRTYLDRTEPPVGVKGTIFLLEKTTFEGYRKRAGYETQEVRKRSSMWPETLVDQRPGKKLKV
jgi:hypothetical protein